jgi:uncharacterized protein (TIGR02246 family)
MRIITLLLALSTLLYSCKTARTDIKAEEEKLMQLSREWSRSASTDSLEKTLSYWAEDAIFMSPGQAPLKGKQAIREMIVGMSKIPGFKISWEPISASVSESGDMAYLVEQNEITVTDSTGKPITEQNKAVTIWKKQKDGSWKNVVDIWNLNPSKTR